MGQKTYDFTLLLAGVPAWTEEVWNALYEAGCDDALLGMREGVAFLDFSRKAASFREAVASATADVQRADIGAQVIRVEPAALVKNEESTGAVSYEPEP